MRYLILHRTATGFIAHMIAVSVLIFSALSFLEPATAQGGPPLNGNIQSVNGPDNLMILLDSSYSMSETLGSGGKGGPNKMMVAKNSVLQMIQGLPSTTNVGLRIYGNSSNPITACHATSTLVPLGQNNRNMMAAQLLGVQPTGSTPISYSIIQSLNQDFQNMPGKRSLILISDGIETCGEDPCTLAVRMQQMGANVKINVIGLGIQDIDAIKQLRCVALATKGRFYTANTAAELANSLNHAMAVETHVQATILPDDRSGKGQSSSGPPAAAIPPNRISPPAKDSSSPASPSSVWLDARPASRNGKTKKRSEP
jgi:hypothetical protein